MPTLKPEMQLKKKELLPSQHFTQPPARFTEASLIKTLEEFGIGRPSTYATTISTITGREYVEREGKSLKPTELGEVITDLMKERFPNIVNVKFTANLEDELDTIESGKNEWTEVLENFYGDFKETLAKAKEEMKGVKIALKEDQTDIICDKCGKNMVVKVSRFGKFLSCSGYPECKNKMKYNAKTKEAIPDEVEETDVVCEKCGKNMVVKYGRFGKFLACPGYPECKNIKGIDEETGVKCPKCDGAIVKRRSKRGRMFYGCNKYPDCDFVSWDEPLEKKCPNCGKNLFKKVNKKTQKIYCLDKDCGYEEKIEQN